jgi:hypothetical protein
MYCDREGSDSCVKDVDTFDAFSDFFMFMHMHEKKKHAQEDS